MVLTIDNFFAIFLYMGIIIFYMGNKISIRNVIRKRMIFKNARLKISNIYFSEYNCFYYHDIHIFRKNYPLFTQRPNKHKEKILRSSWTGTIHFGELGLPLSRLSYGMIYQTLIIYLCAWCRSLFMVLTAFAPQCHWWESCSSFRSWLQGQVTLKE